MRKERGLVDRTFDLNRTNPIDRHQRTINRTDTVGGPETKVPTWEERMAYIRRQVPPHSRRPILEPEDDSVDIGRAETPIMEPYPRQRNEGDRVPNTSSFSASAARSRSQRGRFRGKSEEQDSRDSRHIQTLAERQQAHSQTYSQPQQQPSIRPVPSAPRPYPLHQGPRGFVEIRSAETPPPPAPASAPRTDWRNSEWMAQYQAQAEDDPFAKFYGN